MSNDNIILFPKATALWLIKNTSLTHLQISGFCGIHISIIKRMHNDTRDEVVPIDPVIKTKQLTQKEIERCQNDSNAKLQINSTVDKYLNKTKKKQKSVYTPIARRQDKPNAILWLIKKHPDLKDSHIIKLIGTSKANIESIRDRSHWNIANIQPQDPVLLGLCTQSKLDSIVKKQQIESSKENNDIEDL